ncbi:trifunctional serine/threonine-protein kinase/ATP-binding protein/sensor histidine kinase [Aerosakkonema funiforme]|uniref:trifunctional serine/threonine-protein kinase/ATP-binding protein/sensor histidine kinase n=1 Tax=Aerosakkonema funiforme TaxID=1246630 RepID=UPI0035B7A267
MLALSGYKITQEIVSGFRTAIFRGYDEQQHSLVIIKVLKSDYPTVEEITRLKQEYKITHNLECEGIVKAINFKKYLHGFALILEDFGGQSLQQLIASRQISLSEFLNIAIALARTLYELHKLSIIHKDIKPSNIIINPLTEQVKITDFSIATRLDRETQIINNPNSLEGTLAYMSPEQTGRMNRALDYRTDFYSLGVTFYEILTGQLPFTTTDTLELVYCHIAVKPVPPHQLNPEIPSAVSEITMKLLAKTAEERYQSAEGLKFDLENCLEQLQRTGKIEKFTPGKRDKKGQFLIPQKLYGREAEVATLMATFERVSAGAREMMLIAGYSGIGKSALVNEVHKPIVQARGYFIAGKFDQFQRNIPYAALIQAFRSLMQQLLTESAEKLEIWQQKLLEALGQNGQIIIDVIPEVELIIGMQSPVPELGPTESQNRFNRVFQQFIHVFCQADHPLVVFLDDLQWADAASLKLIELLMTDPDSKYLLTIGAYRDNEVSATHPLIQKLESIQKAGAMVNTIVLKTLNISHVSQLIADTIDESEKSKFLAELVFNKTQGNPFFLTQLLKTLYSEKLLTYDFSNARWQWDFKQIQAIGIADYNIVELVARNIKKLPKNTQNVLKLAACIGNLFNLNVLAIVNESSASNTATFLWDALQAGLILPLSETYKIPLVFLPEELGTLAFDDSKVSYKFLHDRVQQAAYSLIPEAEKQTTHLKIGQMLLKNNTPQERDVNIFDIVNQLNFGVDLIADKSEKYELASLNLIAGQKAKSATAYEAALKYLNMGIKLLAADSWLHQYDLTLNLYVEAVEAEYLNTNFDRASEYAEIVLQQAKQLLDRVKVYEAKMQMYMAKMQMPLALDTGISVLEMLGVSLENEPPKTSIEDLINLPEMNDIYKLAAMRCLINLFSAVYVANPAQLPQIIFTLVHLSIKYGNSSASACGYVLYALLLCGSMGDIDSGYRYGELALRILDKFNAREIKCRVLCIFNGLVRIWQEHLYQTLESLRETIQIGLETGDIEYAGYAANNYCYHSFFLAEHLELIAKKSDQYINLMLKLKQDFSANNKKILRQMVLNFLGQTEDKCRLIGGAFNETSMLPIFIKAKNSFSLFSVYLAKTILTYYFKEPIKAVKNALMAGEYVEAVTGGIGAVEHNFYHSLALLANYTNVHPDEQQKYLLEISANQEKMQVWALHAPMNYQHKYDLVEAEKARVLGQNEQAIALYDRAILAAGEQGYIQEEALANELAAEFHAARSSHKIAQFYLTEAYYGYIRWGATAKVNDLESKYPQYLSKITSQKATNIDIYHTTTTTSRGIDGVLDLATVMKASLAISSEIMMSQLICQLMKIAIENAGATKGCIILVENGKFIIEAAVELQGNAIIFLPTLPIEISKSVPLAILNYVQRTQESVLLTQTKTQERLLADPYIAEKQPKSLLCTPIIQQKKLIGLFYLENNLATDAFTSERLEVLKLLSSQAAISLENARLVASLEDAKQQLEEYSQRLEVKVESRTQELQKSNQDLQSTLQKLQQTQTQLIQTEKMSSLGQLVAGIAHEINNPINFIYGNLTHANEYTADLLRLIELYQETYSQNTPEIDSETEAIDLDFIKQDLPKILTSMKVGSDRIRQLVLSLRNFSRLDEAEMKSVDIHSGIDSTLLILQHRLKGTAEQPAIQIIKEYSELPAVECYAGQMNQVFMNILTNAIDALEQQSKDNAQPAAFTPNICIRTRVVSGDRVAIHIIDNALGMAPHVRSRLFEPFFTTKPIGSGTGLGLAISYQIVVEKHGGQLKCFSEVGKGSEFAIEIPIKPIQL